MEGTSHHDCCAMNERAETRNGFDFDVELKCPTQPSKLVATPFPKILCINQQTFLVYLHVGTCILHSYACTRVFSSYVHYTRKPQLSKQSHDI